MPETQEERLKGCLATVFPDLSDDEILRASHTSIANWDSLAIVTLVSVIEEEFGITIALEEYEYMISFELIRECLEKKFVSV